MSGPVIPFRKIGISHQDLAVYHTVSANVLSPKKV